MKPDSSYQGCCPAHDPCPRHVSAAETAMAAPGAMLVEGANRHALEGILDHERHQSARSRPVRRIDRSRRHIRRRLRRCRAPTVGADRRRAGVRSAQSGNGPHAALQQ